MIVRGVTESVIEQAALAWLESRWWSILLGSETQVGGPGGERADYRGGDALGLTEDELAFYDALETNDSAVKVLGDETLRAIAQEVVRAVRHNLTVDWTLRENVRAHVRVLVKRILRKHGYPPDGQERATQTVLEQAELLSGEWVTSVLA